MKSIVDKLNEVNESLAVDRSHETDMNEGFKDVVGKIKNFFKITFKKIKNWVVAVFDDGHVIPAMSPVNTALAVKNGAAPDDVRVAAVGTLAKLFSKNGVKSASLDDIIKSFADTKKSVYESANRFVSNGVYEGLELSGNGEFGPDVDTEKLKFFIKMRLKNPEMSVPLLIWGAPGVGKTAIVSAVAKEVYGKTSIITKNLSSVNADDFQMPMFIKNSDGDVIGVEDVPKTWLPMYKVTGNPENDAIADNIANGGDDKDEGKGGVIFFDELSRTKGSVQNVALTLIQDRMLGDFKLGSKWVIISASNRAIDDPTMDINLSRALKNRFSQVNFVPEVANWLQWAEKQAYMNKDVLNFIKFNQSYWYLCNPDDDEENVFATPRSWENCCKTLAMMANASKDDGYNLDDIPSEYIRFALESTVSPKVATEFMTYYDLTKTIDVDALMNVFDKPEKAPSLKKGRDGKTIRTDIKYYMVNKALSSLDQNPKNFPSVEAMDNFAKWLVTGGDESLGAGALAILYKMYPGFAYKLGNPQCKEAFPDWDKYASMVTILIDGLPGLDADIDTGMAM